MEDRHFWQGQTFWRDALWTWSLREAVDLVPDCTYQRKGGTLGTARWQSGRWAYGNADSVRLTWHGRVPWDTPRLLVDLDGEGLVRIDGAPAFGLNAYHRAVDLPLRADESIVITVEVVRTGLMGQAFVEPRLRRMRWERRDPLLTAASWDLAVLTEWALDPHTPADQRRWLAGRLGEALRPVTARPAERTAWREWLVARGGSAEEEQLYQRLIVDQQEVPGLSPHDSEELMSAAHETGQRLRMLFQRLHDRYPKGPGAVRALGHAHIDYAWLWPVRETRQKIVRTVASQLNLLGRHSGWVYGMSSPEMWKGVAETEPRFFERLQAAGRAGRVEPLGAFWLESDGQLLHPAAALRQVHDGLGYFLDTVGERPTTAFLPDSFGYAGGLPTFLAAAGIRSFWTTKLTWNDTNPFPYRDFWWVGPDGGRVAAHLFGGAYHGYNGLATLADVHRAWEHYRDGGGVGTVLYTFGYGDGGGGPTEDMLERLTRYRQLPSVPAVSFGSAGTVDADDDVGGLWPTIRGPLYLEAHRAVFTSQTAVKSGNVTLPQWVLAMEAWQTWRGVHLFDAHDAWRRVLRNQFHDILPGSAIAEAYVEWRDDLLPVETGLQRAWEALVHPQPDDPGHPPRALRIGHGGGLEAPPRLVTVDAPGPFRILWPTAGDAAARWLAAAPTHDGHWIVPIPGQAALTWQDLAVEWGGDGPDPVDHPLDATGSAVQVELPTGLVTVTAEGIASWVDTAGRERLTVPAGVRGYWNHPAVFDAWELEPGYEEREASWTHEAPRVLENNAWRLVVGLRHHVGPSVVGETITLERVSGRVSSRLTMTLMERHLVVRYLVPTSLHAPVVDAETLWGVEAYPTVPEGPEDAARFEWVAHRFVSLQEPHCGLALANDGRYGHSVRGGTLGVTLATTPLYPDPDADREPSPVTLTLMPHRGSWRDAGVANLAHAAAVPPYTAWVGGGPGLSGPIQDLPPHVMVLAWRPARDGSGDVIAALGETWGDETRVAAHLDEAFAAAGWADVVTDELREGSTPLEWDPVTQTLRLTLRPWSLAVVRLLRASTHG